MQTSKKSIAELKEMTERLSNELDEEKIALRKLAEFATDGYWDWRIKDDYEYMSPRFWEIFGIDHKTKKPHPSEWQALVHPEDGVEALKQFETHCVSKGEQPYNLEIRYKHSDGHIVWVVCRGKVISWDENGNPERMVGTHTDITTSKGPKQDAKW